jgi:nicotinate phosphoribosyltransferase
LLAARASYLAGFGGTATVLAGRLYDIPIFGTMAHSYIQAHDNEAAAFESFAHAQPDNVILLIDTYDTEQGARVVVELAPRLARSGIKVKGVRLDSGDLAQHARKVRKILDDGDLRDTVIFSSGSLDEYELRELLQHGAPIDGFGVGTRLDTSADVPYLDCAYKLVEYAGHPRRKRSEGKATWPGRKQVYRWYEHGNSRTISSDIITTVGDPQEGEALIAAFMQGGERVIPAEPLARARERTMAQLDSLPQHLRMLADQPSYPVHISPALEALAHKADQEVL